MIKMLIKIGLILGISGMVVLLTPRLMTAIHGWARIQSVEEISPQGVAIVFGAGLWRDGSPTPVLRDRVATATDLYLSGKVEKLLMSGDNRVEDYNEPAAMRDYAMRLGVPEDAIVMDYAGRRTYDTCYRAREIFGLDSAILVTQSFHLPRALYTCHALGIDVQGVSADLRTYRRRSLAYWHTREAFATLQALLDVHILQPLPVLGNPEPILTESTDALRAAGEDTKNTN
jgi:SanA protein